ncbi:hypothetical protein ABGB19_18680 [Mycobacterium sp. B14F4]|uniref:hypothetical protein n=1 Tax=Mycobacterium sp. B14F4 TaxID=3153565 RepID=UPI00325F4298
MTTENTDEADIIAAEEPDSTAAEVESTAEQEPASESPAAGRRAVLPGLRRRIGALVLTLLLVASAGVAAWLYFFQFRPDQQTDAGAREVVLEAAKTGTVALLSYSPETLDADFTNAKSHLTGDFLDYYTQFTEQIVTPAAKQKQVKTSAAVVQAAVAEMQPTSAVVLVFVNQNTVSKENPDGAFAASAVKVAMTNSDGRWLINAFDPV